jgi:cephalosporin hydroxylase
MPTNRSEQDTIERFHRLYYDSMDKTWKDTWWLGVRAAKCPLDFWIYQEILSETRPDVIIECGTAFGGSALFMASVFDVLGHGEIMSIDIEDIPGRPHHPRISYVLGSSTDPEIVRRVVARAGAAERVMVILDSDHRRDHVRRELRAYSPLVTPGCYLVVEDANLNGHPVVPEFGPGPREALDEFLEATTAFEVDRGREKLMLTFNPGGYLRRL